MQKDYTGVVFVIIYIGTAFCVSLQIPIWSWLLQNVPISETNLLRVYISIIFFLLLGCIYTTTQAQISMSSWLTASIMLITASFALGQVYLLGQIHDFVIQLIALLLISTGMVYSYRNT